MTYNLHKVSILVVEDNVPMLEITKSLLITFGIGHVVGARNGEQGFELFKEHKNDIVIADWMMKPTDGISFTRIVRNDHKSPNPFVPIILMTGFSEKRRVIQARDAGVTEFLVKPFNAKDLYKRIAQVIERPRQFVRSPEFFGPDRRRVKNAETYEGPFRRDDDLVNPDIIRQLQQQQREAHATLDRYRQLHGIAKGDKFNFMNRENRL